METSRLVPTDTFRVVDAHVHIGRGEIRDDPLMSNILPADILRGMAEARVERSIIFAPYYPGGYHDVNQEVAGYVADNPRRFLGFGRVRSRPVARLALPVWRRGVRKLSRTLGALDAELPGAGRMSRWLQPAVPPRDSDGFEEARRCLDEYGFSGMKIHPHQDGLPSHAVFGLLQDQRKPVLFHCGTGVDLRLIEETVIRRYTMPIILAHMGGYAAERRMYVAAIALARKYPHVYLDTSYVFFQYILEMALTTCPDKIIFGSDAPGVHPAVSISCILLARVSDEVKQMVLADNICRILGEIAA
jgi:predicted TIM-barrel fold metal-dependent hydrolase